MPPNWWKPGNVMARAGPESCLSVVILAQVSIEESIRQQRRSVARAGRLNSYSLPSRRIIVEGETRRPRSIPSETVRWEAKEMNNTKVVLFWVVLCFVILYSWMAREQISLDPKVVSVGPKAKFFIWFSAISQGIVWCAIPIFPVITSFTGMFVGVQRELIPAEIRLNSRSKKLSWCYLGCVCLVVIGSPVLNFLFSM
jgi:hypothetical protein